MQHVITFPQMAETKRVPVYGLKPPCAVEGRLEVHRSLQKEWRSKNVPPELNQIDKNSVESRNILNTSYSFVDHLRSREYGMREYRSPLFNYNMMHIICKEMFNESIIPLSNMNKVFCSQWIGEDKIVFGTKCGKLIVYDLKTKQMEYLTLIKGRGVDSRYSHRGVHVVKANKSNSLMVTSAHDCNEITVYSLPNFIPLLLAEKSHTGCVYDIEWLDDKNFVSGGEDNLLSLWSIPDNSVDSYTPADNFVRPDIRFLRSQVTASASETGSIRSIKFNRFRQEMIMMSSNGYVHLWDVNRFKQNLEIQLSPNKQHICMDMRKECDILAVSNNTYTNLIDSRTLSVIKIIPRILTACPIKSLCFKDNLLTLGSATGGIMFYDVRAGQFLESEKYLSRLSMIKTRHGGHITSTDIHHMNDQNVVGVDYNPAVFTLGYNYWGSKLFTGGGPLPNHLVGYYCAIWE